MMISTRNNQVKLVVIVDPEEEIVEIDSRMIMEMVLRRKDNMGRTIKINIVIVDNTEEEEEEAEVEEAITTTVIEITTMIGVKEGSTMIEEATIIEEEVGITDNSDKKMMAKIPTTANLATVQETTIENVMIVKEVPTIIKTEIETITEITTTTTMTETTETKTTITTETITSTTVEIISMEPIPSLNLKVLNPFNLHK